jgi:ectoine hydroxylase-related dioxygenase (phytanoyl-CoA dioxygenase family)
MSRQQDFKLSAEQVNFFNLFGYLVLPDLFSADEMTAITREYELTFAEGKKDVIDWKHQAHHGYLRKVLPQFIDRSAMLSALIDDPRIHNIFSGLLGEDFDYRGSDANIFENSTVWHSDTYGALFKYLNVKLAFYLEEIEEKTGCFRVIPGSHQFGDQFANQLQKMLGENDSLKDVLGLDDIDVPSQVLPTKPGDLLVFDFRLKHATCFEGPAVQRRSFTICGSQRIADKDIPKLRGEIKVAAKFGYRHYYGKQMVATADKERLVHLEQCMAQDDVFLDDKPG